MGKFIIKETKTGIKFDLKAANGEVIATSEVYAAEASCRKGIASVIKNAPIANIEDQTADNYEVQKHPKFEIYLDKAVSEGYKTMRSCKNGIASVQKNAADSPIEKN